MQSPVDANWRCFRFARNPGVSAIDSRKPTFLSLSGFGECIGDYAHTWAVDTEVASVTPQRSGSCQCAIGGAGVPSDQVPTQTMKIVALSSRSFAAIIGEPCKLAPQLFAASPGTKNIT